MTFSARVWDAIGCSNIAPKLSRELLAITGRLWVALTHPSQHLVTLQLIDGAGRFPCDVGRAAAREDTGAILARQLPFGDGDVSQQELLSHLAQPKQR